MKRFRKTMATILSFLMCFTLFTNVAHAEENSPIINDNIGEIVSYEEEYYDSDNEDLSIAISDEDNILENTDSEETNQNFEIDLTEEENNYQINNQLENDSVFSEEENFSETSDLVDSDEYIVFEDIDNIQNINSDGEEPFSGVIETQDDYIEVYNSPDDTDTETETFKVAFDVNGGDDLAQTEYEIPENTEYGEMPKATKLGYVLDGWFTDPENGVEVVSSDLVTGDIILYAHWSIDKEIKYKVYHIKETTYGNYYDSWPDEKDELKGEAFSSITPAVKEYVGFISPETQTVEINPDGSTIVYYRYARKTFNLTWDFDGGTATNTYTNGEVKYGSSITAPRLNKPGYVHVGWDADVPSTMPTNDLSFKALYSTNIWIGGIEITEDNAADLTAAINEAAGSTVASGSASYDFSNRTLYLNDFNYLGEGYEYSENHWVGLYVTGRELNISVSGTNSIVQHKASVGERDWCYGYLENDGSTLSINGSGSLLFKADAVDDLKWNSYGLRMYASGDVRVSGVDLKIIAEPVKNVSRGLYFYDYGDINLSNKATVEIAAGSQAAYYNYNDDDAGNFEHPSGYYYLTGELFDGSDASLNTTVKDAACYMTAYKYIKLSHTDLFVGGIPIIEQNSDDIVSAVNSVFPESASGTITYNKDEHILTLNNFNLTNKNTGVSSDEYHCGICYSGTEDLTIKLIGDNSITSSTSYDDYTAGIYYYSNNLNIIGDGNLSVKGADQGYDRESYGIMVNGTVTIDGPSVETTGGNVSRYSSIGLYGGVNLKSGTLTATGGSAGSASYYYAYTYGIYGSVTVDDGTLNAYGGTAQATDDAYSYGIAGYITVNQGTVNVLGGDCISTDDAYSYGIYGNLTLNQGTVNVTAGKSEVPEGEEYDYNYSYGIYGDAIVNDGILSVTTLNSRYCAYGIEDELNVKGGTVNVNTGDSQYCIGVYRAKIDGGIVNIQTGKSTLSSTGISNECRVNGGTVTITPGDSDGACRGTGYLYVYGGNTEINTGKGTTNNYGVSSLSTYSGNVKIVAEDASENSFAVNGYTYFSGGQAELISKGTGSAAQVINYSYISISTSKSGIDFVSRNSDGSNPEEYDEGNLSQYKYLKTAEAYGLRVGDKIVTSANCGNVFGDGKVSFDLSSETLKLKDASLEASGYYAVIQVDEGYLENLTIEVSGQNTLTYTGTKSEACGIFSFKNVNVKFDEGAELNVRSPETSEGSSFVGVRANGLTVDGKGTFNIYGRQYKDFNGSSTGLRVGTKLVLSNGSTLNVYGGDFVNTDDNYHNNDIIAIWTYQGTAIEIGDGCELNAITGVYKSGYNSGRRIGLYYNTSGTITLKGSAKVKISAQCAEEDSGNNYNGYGLFLYNSSYNDYSAYFNIVTDSWNGSFEIEGDDYVIYNTGYYYSSSKIKHDPNVVDIICYDDTTSMCISEEEFGSTYLYYKKMYVRPHQTYNVTIKPGKGVTPTTVYNEDCACVEVQYYYPDEGYYFSDDIEDFSVNGIKVYRPSQYYIYVSGVPTADTTIVLPDATVKPAVTSVVSFDANGGSGTKTNETVNKGSAYTLPAGNTFGAPQGYTFDKWEVTIGTETSVNKNPGESITINADTKVKALWKAATGTAYKVEHYKQGLDGKYTASPEVENLNGTTGASVKPALKSYEGFVAPAAQTGTIKADGSLVIKYYYTRNSYQLKWNLDGGKASGTYTSGTVKYGESIKAPTLSKDGYTFKSWDATVPSTMPAKNLTFTAKWEKKEKTEEELVTDFVRRFYKEVLGRSDSAIEKDSEGINDWVTKLLTKEKTGAEVAKGFVNSKEFKNRNVKNEEFVRIMYVSFFGREPDEGGYKGWIDKLNAGTSREDVLAGFTNSQEFKNLCAKYNINPGKLETSQSQQNKPAQQPEQSAPPLQVDTSNVDQEKLDAWIERLYDKALGRKSDAEGKAYWKDVILNGEDAKGNQYDITSVISTGFLNSKEYKNKNTDNKQFVADCYAAFFNRDPRGTDDEVHYNDWVRQLDEGLITRKQMIEIGFGHSKEFKNLLESYNFKIIE